MKGWARGASRMPVQKAVNRAALVNKAEHFYTQLQRVGAFRVTYDQQSPLFLPSSQSFPNERPIAVTQGGDKTAGDEGIQVIL